MSSPRYPVPPRPPRYRSEPGKVSARAGLPLFQVVAGAFVVVALLLAFWLAALLLGGAVRGHRIQLLNLFFFWAVLAYLALPRVHQVFTLLYLPDYFIGRTRTADGVLGDPINLCLDGSATDVHAAMRAAGWVQSDEYSVASVYRMIVSSLFRRSYPAAPISALFLFDRRQDFAYQQEVDGNPARRHHVRFWRAPEGWLLPGGQQTQWLAAATYDRAVGLSAFTGQITHKIDEDIDIERDYLIDTIRYVDHGSQVHVIHGFSTAYHHRNGGGDRVHTDGDMPILDVTDAEERIPGAKVASHRAPDPAIGRHHVPPPPLIVAGALVLLRLVVSVVGVFVSGMRVSTALGAGRYDLALAVGAALLSVVLWWFVVARRRTAWVLLMLVACVDAVGQMLGIDAAARGNLGSMLIAALAVLTVLSASATQVRDWVSRGRRDPEVHLPDAQRLVRQVPGKRS